MLFGYNLVSSSYLLLLWESPVYIFDMCLSLIHPLYKVESLLFYFENESLLSEMDILFMYNSICNLLSFILLDPITDYINNKDNLITYGQSSSISKVNIYFGLREYLISLYFLKIMVSDCVSVIKPVNASHLLLA